MVRLAEKVAIITGTGGSIGRAAAIAFAAQGARVVGCDVNGATAQSTVDAVRSAGGEMVSHHPCDLGEAGDAKDLIDLALSRFGRIDILYNNAALAHFEWFGEMNAELFHRTLRDEVDVVFHACKAVWPLFADQSHGVIVNTASVSGIIPYEVVPGLAHTTAKAGVIGMTRHLAMEGAPLGIRVNAISPGLVETNQTIELLENPDWARAMINKIMLKRVGQPDEIAKAALFLASDEAAWITGVNLPVDGGTTAW